MHNKPLLTTGLIMPGDFDCLSYEAIFTRIGSKSQNAALLEEYGGAWSALAYRYFTLCENDENYTNNFIGFGGAPAHPNRYVQERELFAFFVTGLSAIESFCYGIYAIASMLYQYDFPLSTDREKKSVYPESTTTKFMKHFPAENITGNLDALIKTTDYMHWKEIRNTLAHRTLPGRNIFAGGPPLPTEWKIGIKIDSDTTRIRRKWISDNIGDLLKHMEEFVNKHFP